jgi:cation diffusion facilitator CzcD-associated flavoprotein CzcO
MANADRKFRVVVAGAAVSGLFMAEMLKRARIDFAVYEKAGEVGGTWRDNTFQPNYNWSRKYAPATEIWAYITPTCSARTKTGCTSCRSTCSPKTAASGSTACG